MADEFNVIECGFCKASQQALEDHEDKIDGLSSELDLAIDLMTRVACGEQSVHNMGEWVSLNFPTFRDRLPKEMQATPPT